MQQSFKKKIEILTRSLSIWNSKKLGLRHPLYKMLIQEVSTIKKNKIVCLTDAFPLTSSL